MNIIRNPLLWFYDKEVVASMKFHQICLDFFAKSQAEIEDLNRFSLEMTDKIGSKSDDELRDIESHVLHKIDRITELMKKSSEGFLHIKELMEKRHKETDHHLKNIRTKLSRFDHLRNRKDQ